MQVRGQFNEKCLWTIYDCIMHFDHVHEAMLRHTCKHDEVDSILTLQHEIADPESASDLKRVARFENRDHAGRIIAVASKQSSLSDERVPCVGEKKHTQSCPMDTVQCMHDNERALGKRKRKTMSDAEREHLDKITEEMENKMLGLGYNRPDALDKFLDCFMTWILINSSSIPLRCVEDPLLTEALKALGCETGICRRNLCTQFLDKKYQESLSERQRYLKHFECFQVASNLWELEDESGGKTFVGATLNFPDGCQLGDVFATTDATSGHYIFQTMTGLIDQLGQQYYIGCVFDGKSAYQDAGKRLQEKYPGSIHVTCQAYVLNLLAENISRTDLLSTCFKESQDLLHLCSQTDCKSVLEACQQEMYNETLSFRPINANARFNTRIRAVKDLLRSKQAIKMMAKDDDLLCKFHSISSPNLRKAFWRIFQYGFWDKLELVVDFLTPVVDILDYIEQEDKPKMTQMYFVWRFLMHYFRCTDFPSQYNEILLNDSSGADVIAVAQNSIEHADMDIFTLAFLLDLRFYRKISARHFVPPVRSLSQDQVERAKNALQVLVPVDERESVDLEFEHLIREGISVDDAHLHKNLVGLIHGTHMPTPDEWRLDEGSKGNFDISCLWIAIDSPLLQRITTIARNLFSLHVTATCVDQLWPRLKEMHESNAHGLDPDQRRKLMMVSIGHQLGQKHAKSSHVDAEEWGASLLESS